MHPPKMYKDVKNDENSVGPIEKNYQGWTTLKRSHLFSFEKSFFFV
jgi:hypothetical protein